MPANRSNHRKRKAPPTHTPVMHTELTSLVEIDPDIPLKLAAIADPEELFRLAEANVAIYQYILQVDSLFKKLWKDLNSATILKIINNHELFNPLSPHHLVTLGQLRPEIVKEILENYPWAFHSLTGDDLVSLSENNLETAQEILRSESIRKRLSRENLLTLYQRDETKTLLLEIVSYADLFKLINVGMLPLEDANCVYNNINIHTLFNHAQKDKEIYQIILNNPPLLERVNELSKEMINDDLLLCCPPELLVRFGILYPDIASKIIRFCVLPPFSLLTGDHFAELGRNNSETAREILKNTRARKRLNRENLLTLCEEDPTLLSEIIGHEELSKLLFSETLSPENKALYTQLDPDALFNLTERYTPVSQSILRDFSLFKKMCLKTTLTHSILFNDILRPQLSADHLAILTLLDPSIVELVKRKFSFFPTIDNFISIGKHDPEMIEKILSTATLREQLDEEDLCTLYQSLDDPLRGEALLAILTYSDLFKLINLGDLPKRDAEYIYHHIDPQALLVQANEDPEIYRRILDDIALFEKLCSDPEVKKEILNNPRLRQSLSEHHFQKLNLGLLERFMSTLLGFFKKEAPPPPKATAHKRKSEPTEKEIGIARKQQRLENQTMAAGPSHLIAYNQKRGRSSNTVQEDNDFPSASPQKKRKANKR